MSESPEQRAYVVLGDSRRNAAARVVKGGIENWRKKWSHAVHDISVQIEEEPADAKEVGELSEGCVALGRSSARGMLTAVEVPARLAATLLDSSASYGGGSFSPDTLEGGLVEDVARSLSVELLRLARVSDASTEIIDAKVHRQSRTAWSGNPGSGFRSLSVSLGQKFAFRIFLHVSILDVLAPPNAKPPMPSLQTRRSAIGEEVLRLEAWLGDGEVSLQELAELSCGDVIVLQKALTEPGYLTTDAGAQVGNFVLGCAGTSRAISVVAAGDRQ